MVSDRRQSSGFWSTFDVLGTDGSRRSSIIEFRPDWKLYSSYGALCVLVFAAALDGASLGTTLPVGILISQDSFCERYL